MTTNEAMFELMDIAQSVLVKAKTSPDGLFAFAERFKEQALQDQPSISGSKPSEEYRKAEELLMAIRFEY